MRLSARTRLLAALASGWLVVAAMPALGSVKRPSWQQSAMPQGQASEFHAAVPMAVAARVTETGGVTRLVFDLDAPVALAAVLTEKPDRLIIDLPEVNFQIDPTAGALGAAGVGQVRAFRFGLFAPGKSRIVVDLAGPVSLRRADVTSIAGGAPSRLTIELGRTDRASFAAATDHPVLTGATQALAGTPRAAASAVPGTTDTDPRPVIVIDPGHGGIDPGASGSAGIVEKSVVLEFASALATRLSAQNRYRIVLTRRDDSFVSLGDRVRIARDADAALLISIHADTLRDATVTGATVYTASDRASDAEAARVAAVENQADDAAGLETSAPAPDVSDILFDLTRRETRTYAHQFQRTLTGYWAKIARLNRNPERSAGFKVLQAPDVPSVLLELGYLSSDKDAKLLASPDWRDKATASIAAAVDTFFAGRLSPAPRLPVGTAEMQ